MNWLLGRSKAPEGLTYVPDFISEQQEKEFVEYIDKQSWDTSISRRTQHYGFRYHYGKKSISEEKVPDIPEIFDSVLDKLKTHFDGGKPNQMIINEYKPGQGIGAHIDHVGNFGPVVASISLLSTTEMDFRYQEQLYTQKLRPKSAVVLSGDARYKWSHAIKPKNVNFRRISLTFRTIRN